MPPARHEPALEAREMGRKSAQRALCANLYTLRATVRIVATLGSAPVPSGTLEPGLFLYCTIILVSGPGLSYGSRLWHFWVFFRDCSESTGLPPEDGYRKVWVRTFEPGGQHDVRSRGVPTRPKCRDHRTRRPATARDRPLQSQRHPAIVPALWALGLSGQAVSSDAP